MYLTPEVIKAAIAADPAPYPTTFPSDLLLALGCTWGVGKLGCNGRTTDGVLWHVHTADGVLVFTGYTPGVLAWLRDYNPWAPFADLSPMHRARLVAAFVGPGLDLLRPLRKHVAACGSGYTNEEHVSHIWDDYARNAGWSYLQVLGSPAAVAGEALYQWSDVYGDAV